MNKALGKRTIDDEDDAEDDRLLQMASLSS
jgi:hypothetical protein